MCAACPICASRVHAGRPGTRKACRYGSIGSLDLILTIVNCSCTLTMEVDMGEIAPFASVGTRNAPRITASYARYVFWVMFAISFLNYLDRYMLSGAINVIAKELNFGIEGIGFISSAFLLVYTFSTLPLAIWADSTNRKTVVATCVAAWSVITGIPGLVLRWLAWRFRDSRRSQADEEAADLVSDMVAIVREVEAPRPTI